MSRLYVYCTKNLHTRQFINNLFLEVYKHTEKLAKAWKRRGQRTIYIEFSPETFVISLWATLTTKGGEICSSNDAWEVFDEITTDISQKLNEQIDIIIGTHSGCVVYFGINRFHEGVLMMGDQNDIILHFGPAFKADGLEAIR